MDKEIIILIISSILFFIGLFIQKNIITGLLTTQWIITVFYNLHSTLKGKRIPSPQEHNRRVQQSDVPEGYKIACKIVTPITTPAIVVGLVFVVLINILFYIM